MKKVLITGANSYVGTNVEKWLLKEPDKYYVETLDMKNPNWKNFDFSKFDVVFHVAGIVHKKEKKNDYQLYHKINFELIKEVAEKAKIEGVSQLIFMSSMAVYGLIGDLNKIEVINKTTETNPNTYYGVTKLKAENEILKLQDKNFLILILRPPMIYGDDAPGNYNKLENFIKKVRIVPIFKNQKSVINIDTFCIFVRNYINSCESGVRMPQDIEKFSFDSFVDLIMNKYQIRIYKFKIMTVFIKLFFSRFTIVKKVFGSLIYDEELNHE